MAGDARKCLARFPRLFDYSREMVVYRVVSAGAADLLTLDALNGFDPKSELPQSTRLQRIEAFLAGQLPDSRSDIDGYAHLAAYQQYGSFGPHASQRVDGRDRLLVAGSENLNQCLGYGRPSRDRPFTLVAEISPRSGVDPLLSFKALPSERIDQHEVGLVLPPDPERVVWHLAQGRNYYRIVDREALHAAASRLAPNEPLATDQLLARGALVAEPALGAVAEIGRLTGELSAEVTLAAGSASDLKGRLRWLGQQLREARRRHHAVRSDPRVQAALRVGREKVEALAKSGHFRRSFGSARGVHPALASLRKTFE